MQHVISSLVERPILTLGLGAFLSGVALFYLVMQRTRKNRIERARRGEA
ncbi:hypothetical protein [Sinisalibacter aestuarii]|nr:hypothetical protein [Sinisalibacter aestuarii]